MKIESTDQEIGTLLASGYFWIPRFQRPYSWTRENIQEFWDDVIREKPTDYFIGAMVVFRTGSQRYGVVDGQQRLTTIAVLLAALRNTLQAEEYSDLAKGIQGLIERRNIDNKPEYILSTETSYPFLQDRILKFGPPDLSIDDIDAMKEEANLSAAFKQLTELLDILVRNIKEDPTLPLHKQRKKIRASLVAIRDALLTLKIILVKLDSEDDAYIIFETLNTRGKDLSLTDLVKNHLSKHLKAQSASLDEPKIKWKTLLETIEGSSLDLKTDTYIHHFWLSRYDYLPAKTLFAELRKRVTKAQAKTFLANLVTDARTYRAIHDIDYGKWEKDEQRIAVALGALQLFRVQQQIPCVLSLVRAYHDRKIRKKHLEDAVVAIEKFHFLFTAITSQRSSGGISAMYARLARSIYDAKNMDDALGVIKELKDKLRKRIPSLDEFVALFPEVTYTSTITRQRGLVRYILATIERETNRLLNPIDYDALTIEHLASQSRIGEDGLTESIVGQVGNLILVSTDANAKLGDKPFGEKKAILHAAGVHLPSIVSEAGSWGHREIKMRTEALAKDAYENHWKI